MFIKKHKTPAAHLVCFCIIRGSTSAEMHISHYPLPLPSLLQLCTSSHALLLTDRQTGRWWIGAGARRCKKPRPASSSSSSPLLLSLPPEQTLWRRPRDVTLFTAALEPSPRGAAEAVSMDTGFQGMSQLIPPEPGRYEHRWGPNGSAELNLRLKDSNFYAPNPLKLNQIWTLNKLHFLIEHFPKLLKKSSYILLSTTLWKIFVWVPSFAKKSQFSEQMVKEYICFKFYSVFFQFL